VCVVGCLRNVGVLSPNDTAQKYDCENLKISRKWSYCNWKLWQNYCCIVITDNIG